MPAETWSFACHRTNSLSVVGDVAIILRVRVSKVEKAHNTNIVTGLLK